MAHEINVYGFMAQHGTYLKAYSRPMKSKLSFLILTTPEISECNFRGSWNLLHTNFSWLMNPGSRYFMSHETHYQLLIENSWPEN